MFSKKKFRDMCTSPNCLNAIKFISTFILHIYLFQFKISLIQYIIIHNLTQSQQPKRVNFIQILFDHIQYILNKHYRCWKKNWMWDLHFICRLPSLTISLSPVFFHVQFRISPSRTNSWIP